jgi:hypothetical protein
MNGALQRKTKTWFCPYSPDHRSSRGVFLKLMGQHSRSESLFYYWKQ